MSGEYDYVIVGSGAGGGPLAANLAKAGFKVLLLEAGGDPCSEDETGRLIYEVPIFHGISTEYPACSWNYYVRHFTDDSLQSQDRKRVTIKGRDFVWYPRAGTLGGCTAHNAMITVVPQDSDWDYIAGVTKDQSWGARHMRSYFERLENCKYVPAPGSLEGRIEQTVSTIAELLGKYEPWRYDANGHGFKGWLPTCESDPKLVLRDPGIVAALLDSVKEALVEHIGLPLTRLETRFDPNDTRNSSESPEGLAFTPLAIEKGRRAGPREYLLRVEKDPQASLSIQKHALVTKVLFEGNRAVGVEYIDKAHVFRADPNAIQEDQATLPRTPVRAKREVILACGAFNTPQLLMLSGVGPREQLDRWKIPVVAELAGVGENLQDRYEIGVISEFARDFALVGNAAFAPPQLGQPPDTYLKEWSDAGSGLYASNGALVGIIKRSRADLPDPDLYIFGLPSYFPGYKPGWSLETEQHRNRFTWAILKARTNNTGRVTLNSDKAWDPPEINFQYFGDGKRQNDPDLESVVSGVKFVRAMNSRLAGIGLIRNELLPGSAIDTDDKLRDFIRTQSWGHHASCTNKIGADNDSFAVLDNRFRVRGTQGLRVVDASIFPKIPGYFIVSAIYMASEKASDVIQEDAR